MRVLNMNLSDLGLGNAVQEINSKYQNIERYNFCISATGTHTLAMGNMEKRTSCK
jgi:hypothetical protein